MFTVNAMMNRCYHTEDEYSYMKPLDLLQSKNLVTLCAPMVRYSKLPFRMLVRKYGCDIAFTPMIVCSSFVNSIKARDNEFTTNPQDRPLIVQFAAKKGKDLADAAEIVSLYSDGVDLNCGCPQRWALSEGYGASLISKPELVRDMVLQTKNRIPDTEFTVSMKIRLHTDIRKTVELCKIAENTGISWITVHGRTPSQRKEPASMEGIKTIKDSVSIPVVGNGDVFCLNDAAALHQKTGVNGVMSARGVLQNPALFSGSEYTPIECVQDWLRISLSLGISFNTFHHHLMFMLEKVLPKTERRVFNTLTSTSSVLDYLDNYLN